MRQQQIYDSFTIFLVFKIFFFQIQIVIEEIDDPTSHKQNQLSKKYMSVNFERRYMYKPEDLASKPGGHSWGQRRGQATEYKQVNQDWYCQMLCSPWTKDRFDPRFWIRTQVHQSFTRWSTERHHTLSTAVRKSSDGQEQKFQEKFLCPGTPRDKITT